MTNKVDAPAQIRPQGPGVDERWGILKRRSVIKPKWLSTKQAGLILGVDQATIRNWVETAGLPAYVLKFDKPGNAVRQTVRLFRIPMVEFEQWVLDHADGMALKIEFPKD